MRKQWSPQAHERVSSGRALRTLKWVSIAAGVSWMTGITILLLAHWVTQDGPATAANPCPSCPTEPLVNTGLFAFGASWLLAIVSVGIMRFTLFTNGPALPRLGTTLLLAGLVLLAAYGLGVIVLIPGLLMLASSTGKVPWLSLPSMALIVVGAAGVIPLLLFASDEPGEPWMSMLYLPPLLLGFGWIRLGLDTQRRPNGT